MQTRHWLRSYLVVAVVAAIAFKETVVEGVDGRGCGAVLKSGVGRAVRLVNLGWVSGAILLFRVPERVREPTDSKWRKS